MSAHWRLFIAIPIKRQLKQQIGNITESLQKELTTPHLKWIPPENFHVTLKFLGKTQVTIIEPLSEALSNHLVSIPSFAIQFKQLCWFPSIKKPRNIAMVVELNHTLGELSNIINKVCGEFGVKLKHHCFTPHLTLARTKRAFSVNTFELPEHQQPIQQQVDKVKLYRSILDPKGAYYQTIKSFKLAP